MVAESMATTREWVAPAAAIMIAANLVGCLGGGGEEGEPARAERPAVARVDSSESFTGHRRAVAALLERFEASVRAGDVERICRAWLAVRENREYDDDNGGRRFCEASPLNSPDRELARGGGSYVYDVVVRRIRLHRSRGGEESAIALTSIGTHRDSFLLVHRRGRWQIQARRLDGWPRPSKRHVLGSDCDERTSVILGIRVSGGKRGATTPRQALLASVFAERIERVVAHGGSLDAETIAYAPDYVETWLLRRPDGLALRGYPVRVWGPRSFDAAQVTFCRGPGRWLRRADRGHVLF
jgi:hypothetical protein